MEFQITIDKRNVTFSNNFRWMLNYKNQFREDPADFLMECLTNIDELDPEDKKFNAKLMKMASNGILSCLFLVSIILQKKTRNGLLMCKGFWTMPDLMSIQMVPNRPLHFVSVPIQICPKL